MVEVILVRPKTYGVTSFYLVLKLITYDYRVSQSLMQ